MPLRGEGINFMNNIRIAKAIALVSLVGIFGCGGSDGTADSALPSLYTGNYTGTWSSPGLNIESQTMTLVVLSDGSLTGTMIRSGNTGTVGGIINKTGRITATTSYAASGNYIIGGTATSANGHLTGSLVISYLGRDYMATFDVAGS